MSKKLIVFSSGSKEGGGSGFKELVENMKTGILDAEIVAVVSNHENGGVRKIADDYGIKFILFKGPYVAEEYQQIVEETGAGWVALSGWLKLVLGLDPQKTINIHPGRIPQFGGSGMYGHFVHEATIEAYKRGEVEYSAVTMHFVTEIYDDGPVFFEYPVWIRKDDTPETLAQRVNKIEHGWQSYITNLIVHEKIKWDGKNPETLEVPEGYNFHHKV
ncbi:phosphoribosylglycinamide formyltransferase [Patescibacteria group bacterium]|nr:phosphoribosylglycinamide formyltransferase [Patescibacteria group bacterium]